MHDPNSPVLAVNLRDLLENPYNHRALSSQMHFTSSVAGNGKIMLSKNVIKRS